MVQRRRRGRSLTAGLAVVLTGAAATAATSDLIFGDGFESGSSWEWSSTVPLSDPPEICPRPVQLVDTSLPDRIVGNGTPASCTGQALANAVAAGGIIAFDCGPGEHTITVGSQIDVEVDTVLDGEHRITLDGGGTSRILAIPSSFELSTPHLTVQRLTFRNGQGPSTGDDTDQGGGAIHRRGGELTVIDSRFLDNRAPLAGQDVAGGAIYAVGGGSDVIVGSIFIGNRASHGGALGNLNNDLEVANSVLRTNRATGTGGNPGNGGSGGAIYVDGVNQTIELCGVRIEDNTGNAFGGGVFRVSNNGVGPQIIDRSVIARNAVDGPSPSSSGGLYLQGVQITLTRSTIADNVARFAGGMFVGPDSTITMSNTTVARNVATTSLGGGIVFSDGVGGSIVHATFADNRAPGPLAFGGATVGGAGILLRNSVFAGHEVGNGFNPITCRDRMMEGGGNLQFPVVRAGAGSDDPGSLCSSAITVADALLGPLRNNGGPTPTMAPLPGSPAVGAGSANCTGVDQRGVARPTPCTSGAFESLP